MSFFFFLFETKKKEEKGRGRQNGRKELSKLLPVSCWNIGINRTIVSSGLYLRLSIIAHALFEQPLAELCEAAAAASAAEQMSSYSAETSSTPRTRRSTSKASCFLPLAARELGCPEGGSLRG